MTSVPTRKPVGQMLAVPVCGIASNALAYVLLLAAARALDPTHYGELVALLGVLLVGTVPSLALQTVTARRVAANADTKGIALATGVLGLGSAAALLVVSAPLARFIHLPSIAGLVVVASALPATTAFGPMLGMAQGSRRFRLLALITIAQGLGRSGGGLVGLLLARDELGSVTGIAVGTTAAAAVVHLATYRRDTGTARSHAAAGDAARHVLGEVVHATHGHGAFLLLTSLDLLLARHVLTSGSAAVYAAGSVISRGALWLPQSIGLLVFARMTAVAHHHRIVRRAGALIACTGVVTVAAVAAAGGLVVTVIGGSYRELASIGWVFALLGACLALIQFSILAGLALRRSRRILVLWLTMGADTAAVLSLGGSATPLRVIGTVTTIAVVAALAMLALAGRDSSGRT